jgi:CheY-like chemotaxis protein
LAELQGGSISVYSEGLGHGSTFTVRLPLAEQVPEESMPGIDQKAAAPASRCKVLIVEDNRDTAMACASIFTKLGHDVQTAYDGVAALNLARSFRPEVIFLDIGLPGMNGYDVAKTLRNEGFADELIVAVSGYGQPEDRQRSRDAGFDDHLVKPVQQELLVSALGQIRPKQVVAT